MGILSAARPAGSVYCACGRAAAVCHSGLWCVAVSTEGLGKQGHLWKAPSLLCSLLYTQRPARCLVCVGHPVLMHVDSMNNSSTNLRKKWCRSRG